jgi:hypothetical protein
VLADALRSALRSAAIVERAGAGGALHRAGGREDPCDRHSPKRPPLTPWLIESADSGALGRALELVLARLCEGYCKAWIDHATTLTHSRRCDKTFSVI